MSVNLQSISEATSGAIGALVSTTILYPLDTCKAKYQAEVREKGHQRYRNLSDVLVEAISNRKVLSLYQGLGTKNLQSFIAQFVYFYGYSYFKKLYLKKSGSKYIGTKANLLIAAAAGSCTALITQGLGTKNLQSFIAQFVYFYRYSYFKKLYLKKSGSKYIGTKANLLIAAAAGSCTALITQPLDTASSRMQTSSFGKSKGLWLTLTGGSWSEAFDGLGISLLLTSNPAIQYTVFDQMKQKAMMKQVKTQSGTSSESLSAFSAFMLGAISKSIATVLTYPAIRTKVMIQASDEDEDEDANGNGKPKSRKTISGVVYSIWKREGLLGFFKGLHAQILKTVLSSALLLMIKEKVAATTWVLILAIRRYLVVSAGRVKNA